MQEIKKVVFLADFLRFSATSEKPNVTKKSTQWLFRTLQFALQKVVGQIKSDEVWHENGVNSLEYYKALGKQPDLAGWAAVQYETYNNKELDNLTNRDFSNTLVIGCELPEVLCQSFNRNNIVYLDTVASPIRFSDDIINCWRSNHPQIQLQIAEFKYDQSLHYYYANMIRAKFIWAKTQTIPTDSALILGQVSDDKSLVDRHSGKFVSLESYKDEITKILNQYSHILYKSHPYSKQDPYLQKLIESNKFNITCTDTNYYQLLCTDNVKHVYGINSGSITEAKYFNVPATGFKKTLYDIADCALSAATVNIPVEVGHDWLTPYFWSKILSPIMEVTKEGLPNMNHMSFKNTLRRSLNADWNFEQIDKVKV
jgi:hypothetical protein